MHLWRKIQAFPGKEGLFLMACTLVSLILANSPFQDTYQAIWHFSIKGSSIETWINDGLMTVFFLFIGLDLQKELYDGQLSSVKKATFPVLAALGGMLVPSLCFFLCNYQEPSLAGIGIPMATDIVFATGILSLLGGRVPLSLKVFLTAYAVVDDLGAILIIAIFYAKNLSLLKLCLAAFFYVLLLLLKYHKIRWLALYLLVGIFLWLFLGDAGIHASLAGVLVAFAIPFEKGAKTSLASLLEQTLHKPVFYGIVPLFALANTHINFSSSPLSYLLHPNSLGIFLGLVVGKPLGIYTFAKLSVRLGLAALPQDLSWKQILGTGFLGGIGFTMSILITLLAFDQKQFVESSKMIILLSSFVAGTLGFFYLKKCGKIRK